MVGDWFNKALWRKLVYDIFNEVHLLLYSTANKNTNGLICNTHNTIGNIRISGEEDQCLNICENDGSSLLFSHISLVRGWGED